MNISIAKPSQIMLIRHAEKPLPSSPPYGVSIDGERDRESLTVQGWIRAGALACFLAENTSLATPQFIYASRFEEKKGSKRSKQTVTPLSRKLGLEINTDFAKGDEEQLVNEVLTRTGVVLICWQHEKIPQIANFICEDDITTPPDWPANRYDLVWICEFNVASGKYAFQQVPQDLLSGDSLETIDG